MGTNEKKVKKEFRLFLLTDYEAEEIYLAKRHKEGYAFKHVSRPGIYTFEKCEPKPVVYRLDFQPLDPSEKDSYIQMYRDYGWEYVGEMNDYCYFRKAAAERLEGDETEIFSDSESRLDMLKRIFVKRMLLILVIFLLLGIPQIYRTFTGEFAGGFGYAVSLLWCILLGVYAYVFVHCGIGFYKLYRKYARREWRKK